MNELVAEQPTQSLTAEPSAQPQPDQHAHRRALDRSLVRGMAWTGSIKWLTQLVTWASTIMVARLLTPADFGLIGMATVYLGLTALFTEFGIGSAILNLSLSRSEVAQLNTVATMLGLAAFALSCAAAKLLSIFFRTPDLTWVVIALSSTFVIDSFRAVPTAVMTKELRFRALALLEGIKLILAAVLTVTFAFLGFSYWSLVLGNVLATLVGSLMIVSRHPQRFEMPRLRELKKSLGFSSVMLRGQLAWYGYSNADFLVAGRILGQTALGAYSYAWTLANTPGEKIMSMLWRVMPAMFASVGSDVAALRRYFLMLTEGLANVLFPATIGVALVAPEFVQLVLGPKWAGAIVPLQLLCFYTGFHMLATLLAPVLHVRGEVRFATRNGLYTLFILPPAFYFFGTRWGTAGIASVWLVVYPLILVPMYAKVFRVLSVSPTAYLRALWPSLSSSMVMVAAVLAVRVALGDWGSVGERLALEVATGVLSYGGLVLLLHRERLYAMINFLKAARK